MGLSVTEYIFSSFLPLCSACCEKHVRLSQSLLFAFHPFRDRLAQGQLVIAHCVISFMCVVTKKGFH